MLVYTYILTRFTKHFNALHSYTSYFGSSHMTHRAEPPPAVRRSPWAPPPALARRTCPAPGPAPGRRDLKRGVSMGISMGFSMVYGYKWGFHKWGVLKWHGFHENGRFHSSMGVPSMVDGLWHLWLPYRKNYQGISPQNHQLPSGDVLNFTNNNGNMGGGSWNGGTPKLVGL